MFIAPPEVLINSNPALYAHLYGGQAPSGSRYAALGGYGSSGAGGTGTSPNLPRTGVYIPPGGGSPYPFNMYMSPGGYQSYGERPASQSLPSQAFKPTNWARQASVQPPRQMYQMQQRQPAYRATYGGYRA